MKSLSFLISLAMIALVAPAFAAGDSLGVTVSQSAPGDITITFDMHDYVAEPVMIEGHEFYIIRLNDEPLTYEKGCPALPHVCRSVIIPNQASMGVQVIDSSYYEVENVEIAPSKGHIYRTTDPASVPYTFGDVYGTNDLYPSDLATLGTPYIQRDVRGQVVNVYPIQYNPVTKMLRVYESVTVRVFEDPTTDSAVNTLPVGYSKACKSFTELARNRFINGGSYGQGRYPGLDEYGEMLIITHDAFASNVQPLANWKISQGMDTTVVNVSTIGNNASSIKNYIQDFYNQNDLAFVLLVGDSAQVATPITGGYAADPTYGFLAGSDKYPDAMIGRFSATTTAHVDTQVTRTIEFEQGIHGGDWQWKGTGIASTEGPGHYGEYDHVHMGYIRDDLIGFGYTQVDEYYGYSASATQVTNSLNAGRGIVNYCGHGSTTSWGTTGFSNTNINNLTNDNMLPWITSVACVNGQFNTTTCFGEAWLRATNGSEPTGAVGFFGSSQYQSWDPPMEGQDEVIDRYIDYTYERYGTLCFAGSCRMLDVYPSYDEELEHWTVFGDPSLLVSGDGSGGPPSVDIKINGLNDPPSVPQGTYIDVTISVDPRGEEGIKHDWWIWTQRNSMSMWWYDHPQTWLKSNNPMRASAATLRVVDDFSVLNKKLPTGSWDFFFCIDAYNGIKEETFKDSASIIIY